MTTKRTRVTSLSSDTEPVKTFMIKTKTKVVFFYVPSLGLRCWLMCDRNVRGISHCARRGQEQASGRGASVSEAVDVPLLFGGLKFPYSSTELKECDKVFDDLPSVCIQSRSSYPLAGVRPLLRWFVKGRCSPRLSTQVRAHRND
jgi:hypothetical protein